MLFALYEFAFVGSVWLFQSAIPIELIGFESAKIFIFLFGSCPSQCSVGLASLVILSLIGMVCSFFFPLPVKLIIFEIPFVLKFLGFVFALLSIS